MSDTAYLNTKAAAGNTYDAIVIGSGISGGWAAKELTQKGLKVLLLERGKDHQHIKDYKGVNNDPWDTPHRGRTTAEQQEKYPVIHRGWAANEAVMDAWTNEEDCPYTEVKPFTWWRSYRMGGRSLLWGRQSYRLSDLDFEANGKEGVGVDWPIRYKDIAPWYDHVEKFAGISGSIEGLPHLPDGQFLPPMDLNCVEKDVAARIKEKFKGDRHLIIGRVANLTKAIEGRTNCQFRNRCWEGCPFGGYFSTQSSTMPAALKTGNLTVRPFSIVTKLLYNKNTKKADGVEVLDSETNITYTFNAKIVFLNASALNSAWVLFNSATDIWPGGLGSSSGELGHNVMDHHYNLGASGTIEGYEELSNRGVASWFGAFHGIELVADLGIVVCGETARYQSVQTDERHRRKGLASHLLGKAADWASQAGCRSWVIVTESTNDAGRVYRKAGFNPDVETVTAYRSEK
jgi:choline dehydrogenase-like flavoprotein